MSRTFSCPNCTANLEHDGGNHLTIQCPYCSSTVIVPEELRPRAHSQDFAPLLAQQTAIREVVRLININDMAAAIQTYKQAFNVDNETAADAVRRLAAGLSLANQHTTYAIEFTQQQTRTANRVSCLVGTIILLFVIGIIATVVIPLVGGMHAFLAFIPGLDESTSINVPEVVAVATPDFDEEIDAVLTSVAEEFAAVESAASQANASTQGQLFVIGERGINPGQFNDARALAVASDGTIYVADRESGRLQTFTPDGTYQTTLPWDKEKFTDDLEIGADGILYAEQSSDIYRYNASTAELLGQITYDQEFSVSFSQLALAVNGDLWAINRITNTLIQFDAAGNVLQAISLEAVPSAVSFDNIAIDGLGNIYVAGVAEDVLGDRQDVVFKFNTQGQFISQFGGTGDEPGLFMGVVSSIAVDGQGHIYVGDFQGIQVFDNNGRFLRLIKIEGAARDIAITNQSELVTITSQNKLYKFDLDAMGN